MLIFVVLKWKIYVDCIDNFTLIDSGHILGAKGLLYDDLFYTGDICTREQWDFFLVQKYPNVKL